MAHPQVGDPAPDFTLPSDNGEISLSSLKGKPVVIYFYPKDDTSGCTKEAIAFSLLKPEFDKIGVRVIGLSPDSATKHAKFRKKHDLTVDLAADEDRVALEAYGVWVEKSMYGRKYMGTFRTTFIINEEGIVERIITPKEVKTKDHAAQIL